ncbi:MAG: ectoine hydroxylase-related dioxygenase (phytanoyl-CoA dioxygenase family) [Candidatus Latescibacterota bacterium]|jgi:ectoine hydroxylase-related dioxygenase (phytanoyl-CoA dioxygenase family)
MADTTAVDMVEQIGRAGFCLLEGVIPKEKVDPIRAEVSRVQAEHHADSEREKEATRARGHRIGARGVGSMRQVINATQAFAAHLADRQVMDIVEGCFGLWSRISCTDCVINEPGNERGYWHADWPYNQTNASHVLSPYPDCLMHLSTIWMLTDFRADNGGTWVLPASHRTLQNPSSGAMDSVDRDGPLPGEVQVEGKAGSVLIYDSRLWHAVAANTSSERRVALLVRYAPWWLNLNPTQPGSPEYQMMVAETGGKIYEVPPLQKDIYEQLPNAVQTLYRHWVQ